MHKLLILVLLIASNLTAKNYTYDYSICAMFKDDAPYLKEWIEYHRMLGFQHFWFYDNGSTDKSLEILTPYIAKGIVDLVYWPSPQGQNWIIYQNLAYNDCMWRSKDATKWLAVIDSDEFIVPVFGIDNFKQILSHFEKKKDCGGIVLNWLMFGTSHVWDIPQGQTLIETLLYRSGEDYGANKHVKTICRPDKVKNFQIHIAEYLPGYHDYTLEEVYNYSEAVSKTLITSPIRINHYWTRTQQYFDEVKIPRRVIFNGRPYTEQEVAEIHTDLNLVYDTDILQFVPELKNRLGLR